MTGLTCRRSSNSSQLRLGSSSFAGSVLLRASGRISGVVGVKLISQDPEVCVTSELLAGIAFSGDCRHGWGCKGFGG